MTTVEAIRDIMPMAPSELVEYISRIAAMREYKKGARIYDVGDVQKNIYFLMDGILRCYFIDELQMEITDSFMTERGVPANSPDILLGEEMPSVIGMEALTDATTCELPAQSVLKMLEQYPQLVTIYVHCLHQSLDFQNEINNKRLYSSGSQRYEWFRKKWPEVDQIASNQQIATFLGMRSESLSRLRRQHKSQSDLKS